MHASGPLPAFLLSFALAVGPAPPGSSTGTTVPEIAAHARLAVPDAARGGTLEVGVDAESAGFDPLVDVLSNAGSTIARAIFDPLAAYDADGVARPYLAESITPNEDATTWTIRLRPGIRFHDDSVLDAAALAAHFEAARTTPLNKGLLAPLVSVTTPDELTVKLTMRQPWGSFVSHLTAEAPTQLGYVVAPAMIDNPAARRHPVGTGPFEFDSWEPDRVLSVRRNEDHWRSPPALDGIDFRVVLDPTVREAAFQRGELDLIATTDEALAAEVTTLATRGDAAILSSPPADPDVLAINTTRPPLDDVRVRRAMSMAIDRTLLVTLLHPDGSAEVMSGPYASESVWHHRTDGSTFDPAEASRLVAEYEVDHGPVAISLLGVQNPLVLAQQELIQSMWGGVGIDAALVAAPQAGVISSVLAGDFDVVGWGGFVGSDPDQDFDAFHSSGSGNITGYADPALDAALEVGRAVSDHAQRRAAYATVQERLSAGMPFVWLTSNQWIVVGGADVRGLGSFTLPDGSPARATTGPRCFLGQVWLDS